MSVNARHCANVLDDILAADPEALTALLRVRVPCNEALRDHPTAQVQVDDQGNASIGLLGVLNAVFTAPESTGALQAVVNNEGTKVHWFRVDPNAKEAQA